MFFIALPAELRVHTPSQAPALPAAAAGRARHLVAQLDHLAQDAVQRLGQRQHAQRVPRRRRVEDYAAEVRVLGRVQQRHHLAHRHDLVHARQRRLEQVAQLHVASAAGAAAAHTHQRRKRVGWLRRAAGSLAIEQLGEGLKVGLGLLGVDLQAVQLAVRALHQHGRAAGDALRQRVAQAVRRVRAHHQRGVAGSGQLHGS